MGMYAIINEATMIVENVILWDPVESPNYQPTEEGQIAVEFFDDNPAGIGWRYDNGNYIRPPAPPPIPQTAEELERFRKLEKERLMREASIAMTPSFMALQLGNATDQETLLAKAWQQYYRDLQAVDVSDEDATWPTPPDTENA